MFGFGRVTCSFCNGGARRRDARKALGAKGVFVCASCYGRWEEAGRKCVACDSPVRGIHDVGLFPDKKNLGHADCGGLRVLRA